MISGLEQSVFALPGAQSPRSTAALSRRLQSERRIRARLMATDALVISVITATVMLGGLLPASALDLQRPALGLVAPVALSLVWLIMLAAFRSRESSILGAGAIEYRRVVHATALSFGLLAVPCLITDWPSLRLQLLVAMPAGLVAVLLGRWQWRRWLLSRWRAGELAPRTILAGDRDEIAHVLARLESLASAPYRVLGAAVADDDGGAPLLFRGEPVPILCARESLATTAERLGADAVILASKTDADADYPTLLSRELEGTCAELLLFSRLTEVAGPRISFRPVVGLPLLRVRIPTFDGGTHVLKRVTDIAVAGAALVAVAIAAVPIALAIKLDSPGPVLFRQQRVGRDGRTFDMLKFRTMRVDAEQQLAALMAQNDGSGPLFKMRNDPRVTRVGGFLRKHSLDELPQFWNALKGDMSVVGPRPPLPHEATTYDGDVMRRLYLKPGITGLWQISGRSDLTWEQSVQLDLRYVENWSVIEDLMIIIRTARVVLRPSGAY
ncbi:sugar transferase [Agrococcus sp. Marseille-P2731]|uniref:sugar transferase n=1 Tax=Agrococcus sp. Marseille-P2731 TaxID=1841862 RepID=UPI001F2AEF7F|nr:sugar transferase [Agrococcus sp. Marseille-P2731]